MLSSAVGQVNWAGAARQCRYDLSFGASHVQQLAGAGDPQALVWLNKLIRRSHQDFIMKIAYLGCHIEELVVLSISDAAYGAQPKGGSQGGLIVAMAHPDVQRGEARLAVVEAQSTRLQRVVRCSMAAELTMAATAFEHGDYIRAVLAEIMFPRFNLKAWKMSASWWKHIMVLDAQVAFDAIVSEMAPTDRKLIVDIAILRETLEDEKGNSFLRWVPGQEMPGDGLTNWNDNGALARVLIFGVWSLCDTELAARIRRKVAGSQKGLESTEGSWHQRGFVLKRRLPAMTLQESCSDPEAIWLPSRHGKVPWRRAATFSIIKKDLFFHVLPWQPRLQP